MWLISCAVILLNLKISRIMHPWNLKLFTKLKNSIVKAYILLSFLFPRIRQNQMYFHFILFTSTVHVAYWSYNLKLSYGKPTKWTVANTRICILILQLNLPKFTAEIISTVKIQNIYFLIRYTLILFILFYFLPLLTFFFSCF